MKIKTIIEDLPNIDVEDINYDRDYVDGLLELKGSKEFQLQIYAESDTWLDFKLEITKKIQVFEGDYEAQDEYYDKYLHIAIHDMKLYEHEEEVELSDYELNLLRNYISDQVR